MLGLLRSEKIGRLFRYLNAAVFLLLVLGFAFLSGALASLRAVLPASTDLITYRPHVTTEIYSTERSKDGSEKHTLLARVFKEDREPIELRDIPQPVIDATVAIEDHLYYHHRGVDPRGLARAAFVNLRGKSIQQGGSTITQQLVRNIWLTQSRTFVRKMKEMLLAFEVERRFSKDEIMEMYLNEVCYGHGAYGIKTAAKLYFGKNVKDLTLAQCALLAGLPQSPTWNSPYRRPEQAKMRRREVLQAMLRYGYITQEQYGAADKEEFRKLLQPVKERSVTVLRAPYFTHLVIQNLCTQYGQENVYQGGLRVYTTLDVRVQELADKYLSEGVEELRRDGHLKGGLVGQGAMACVDVHTGDVMAMVGGVGPYDKTQYNRAQPLPPNYGRQPGSSMKPYVWATALESGYGPSSTFSADPLTIDLGGGKNWSPQNYTPHQTGDYTLRNALAQSVNLVSVRVTRKVGLEKVRQYAARMLDVKEDRLRPTWSLALGASELSPLEQAAGYCCFASGGLRPKKRLWTRIADWRGDVLMRNDPEQVRVIQPETAIDMIDMLHGVITNGTGQRAGAVDCPAGGKTGTTQNERDVWWVGFTPDLSAAIWLGNDDNTPMNNASGGGLAAPIWAKFMKKAMEVLGRNGKFPDGSGVTASKEGDTSKDDKNKDKETRSVTICVDSGGLATPYCPHTTEKLLHPGDKSPGSCTMHKTVVGGPRPGDTDSPKSRRAARSLTICAQSGKIATEYCPQTFDKTFGPGSGPTASCTVHGGGHSTGSGASKNGNHKPAGTSVGE
jgi:penicillin-binding protein 1A